MSARMFGKYAIQAEIGKGPHGTVYRATHAESQRPVAVKVLSREALNPKALEAFRRLAPVLARVRHPLIASFLELVEDQGRVGLVSQLGEGAPLSSLLKQGAYPPPKTAWEIARHLLEALANAHQQGVVHRNLKPGNVLVTPDDRVVLTDLGTAMLHASRLDVPEYASPEHFSGEKITARSDIYQAGVIVYQLVTGKVPFTGDPQAIAHRVAEERPTDPSSYNNKLAWQLDWVVQKALSKDPAERFDQPLAFAEGLRLGLQDTVGRPLPPIEPLKPLPSATGAHKPLAAPAPAATAKPVATIAPPVQAAPAKVSPAATAPAANAPAPAAKPAPKPAPPSPLMQNAKILAAKSAAEPAPAERGGKPGVLFVDDDARILTALKALFRQEYHVETAEGGEAALEILARGGIQVLVSDQRMPGMTGVELLRKVRVSHPAIVRMLLTGYTDLASLVGSINQGEIFKFVMKPWDNDELRKSLAEAFAASARAAAEPAAKPQAPRSAGSLLVIDRTEGVAKGLERLLAGEARVIRVETPGEAAKVLSKEEIAAVVADMGSGMDGLVALFRELRSKRPGVLSILLTDEPDSELAIELINRAQIFRLLPKPVSARDLRSQVAEALRRYSVFKQQRPASKVADGAGAAPGRPLAGAA